MHVPNLALVCLCLDLLQCCGLCMNLFCMYIAHHELKSIIAMITIMMMVMMIITMVVVRTITIVRRINSNNNNNNINNTKNSNTNNVICTGRACSSSKPRCVQGHQPHKGGQKERSYRLLQHGVSARAAHQPLHQPVCGQRFC